MAAQYFVNDDVLVAACDFIRTGSNRADALYVTSAAPTSYSAATTNALASVTGVASSQFTTSDGDTDGKKVQIAAQSGVNVSATGTATHVAWCRVSTSEVLAYTVLTSSQALTSGNTINIPAHAVTFRDATAAS